MRVRRLRAVWLSSSLLAASSCVGGGGGGAVASADGTESGATGSTLSGATGATAAATEPTETLDDTSATATVGTRGPDETDATATSADSQTSGTDGSTGGTDGTTGAGSSESSGGEPLSDDPFDPLACAGMAWTGADALAHLGGLDREVLDGATIQIRTRACPGGVCGAWGANADWSITYLTYSGGVTTRWMDLLASMNLVLFDDAGTPRLSMQHTTFAAGGYPDDDGMLYGFPPAPINYPHIRAFNQFPRYMNDYIDLDYQVSDGTLVLGQDCAAWTAEPFGAPEPHTEQYGALFRW